MCSAGMSTSLLVSKMEKYSASMGYEDIVIKAEPIDDLLKYVDKYDVFLLGPQVRYQEEWVKGILAPRGKSYANIPPQDYGRIDGKKTLELAMTVAGDTRRN